MERESWTGIAGASPIGLGCAFMVGGFEERRNRRLIDAGFDAGIRHFDTAPCYGMGLSENVLGQALRQRRHQVTIATKVGIQRPETSMARLAAHAAFQPIKAFLPKAVKRRNAPLAENAPTPTCFTPGFIEASIAESLKRLQTDYVDMLLLHEVARAQATDETIRLLERLRANGVCRALGVATSIPQALAMEAAYPGFFDVFQYGWNVLERPTPHLPAKALRITHRALLEAYETLKMRLAEEPALAQTLSDACGHDVRDGAILADLMLAASVSANKGGIVLASSRKPERIARFALIAHNQRLLDAARTFLEALKKLP